jgi:hypothetical protein
MRISAQAASTRPSVLGYWLCRIVGGRGHAGRAHESSPADFDAAGRMLQDPAERVAIEQIPEFQMFAEYVAFSRSCDSPNSTLA